MPMLAYSSQQSSYSAALLSMRFGLLVSYTASLSRGFVKMPLSCGLSARPQMARRAAAFASGRGDISKLHLEH